METGAAELELHVFEEDRVLGAALARELGTTERPIEVHRFPDGESRIRVSSEGGRAAVVLRSLVDPNARLLEVLFASDALQRSGVAERILLAPYLGYMRQDRAFRPGEAVSQQVVGRLLGEAFERVLTLEAHLHRIRALAEVVPGDARSLPAAPLIARWCRSEAPDAFLVGPDAESEPWVRAIAEAAGRPWLVARKQRRGDQDVEVTLPASEISAERALVVDDIASSGATLAAVTRALAERGVARVDAVVVHALFGPAAEQVLEASGLERVISTDTIPHPSNAIATAGYFAQRLAEMVAGPGRAGCSG